MELNQAKRWHIITGEYPPQPGGVSDYTQLIATELVAQGDEVHVWCPAVEAVPQATAIKVHRVLGKMAPLDLQKMESCLDQFPAPRRLLVQWVPHSYGYRSMNLPFCLWLWQRAWRKGDEVELMVHEPYLSFSRRNWKQSAAATVHRLMIFCLLQAAWRVWISIPAWEAYLRPYLFGRQLPITWLPVPSNIAIIADAAKVQTTRARYVSPGQLMLGHFGTYGRDIRQLLRTLLPTVLQQQPNVVLLLLGRHSDSLREELAHDYPALAPRLLASGELSPTELSFHVSACDLMFQPYPDGISSRRTSAMVCLCHGRAVVTTSGHLTEPLWAASNAVALRAVEDVADLQQAVLALLRDEQRRQQLAEAASLLYRTQFAVPPIIAKLRQAETGITPGIATPELLEQITD